MPATETPATKTPALPASGSSGTTSSAAAHGSNLVIPTSPARLMPNIATMGTRGAPHPPLSPSRNHAHLMASAAFPHCGGYINRQTLGLPGSVPHSPVPSTTTIGLGASGRSRSRSVGNQPLGWSPQRVGHLSPAVLPGAQVLPGFSDIKLNRSFPEPPKVSEGQRAMEAAVQKERERTKEMEKEEEHLSADELRAVLKRERHRMARLAADLASMRSMAVQSVLQAEVCEEGRINNLMRRLDCLQQEKGRIIVELEREEEMVRAYNYFFQIYFYLVPYAFVVVGSLSTYNSTSSPLNYKTCS